MIHFAFAWSQNQVKTVWESIEWHFNIQYHPARNSRSRFSCACSYLSNPLDMYLRGRKKPLSSFCIKQPPMAVPLASVNKKNSFVQSTTYTTAAFSRVLSCSTASTCSWVKIKGTSFFVKPVNFALHCAIIGMYSAKYCVMPTNDCTSFTFLSWLGMLSIVLTIAGAGLTVPLLMTCDTYCASVSRIQTLNHPKVNPNSWNLVSTQSNLSNKPSPCPAAVSNSCFAQASISSQCINAQLCKASINKLLIGLIAAAELVFKPCGQRFHRKAPRWVMNDV